MLTKKMKDYIKENKIINLFNGINREINKNSDNFHLQFLKTNNDNIKILTIIDKSTSDIKLKFEYDILGIYNISNNLWLWHNGMNIFNEKHSEYITNTRENLKNKLENDIQNIQNSAKDIEKLYYILANDICSISEDDIDNFIDRVIYETQNAIFIYLDMNTNNIKYFIVKQILYENIIIKE